MNTGDRIKKRRKALGYSAEVLAARAGVSVATIYRYEAGDISHMRSDRLEPIAKTLGVTPGWLMGWTDDATDELRPLSGMKRVRIPMVGEVAAGRPILAEQDFETFVEAGEDLRADYALTVRGDSMSPTYLDGDVLFVRAQPDVENGTVAVVLIDDSAAVKHVYRDRDGLTLTSDNPAYPPMQFRYRDYEQIRIFGVVVGFMRMYRSDPLKGVTKGMPNAEK
ncbi:MAG: helix-turn-helix domain-containing protein [Clostridia bacterium]|nr:helix-turn-helix domain-containing protein [Clostridia bacterium]